MTDDKKIKLQGHEKFSLREGWLTKGLIEVPKYNNVFLEKDAAEIFGIGNNMVKSLRYWMKALGLTNEVGSELSELGEMVSRYDVYIEDIFSLWIMHSKIAKNIHNATTWYMYFNKCDAEDLDKSQINKILKGEIVKYRDGEKISEKSLESDVDVLLNMYCRSKVMDDPEDKTVSPFNQLDLIKNTGGKYTKSFPAVNKINSQVILFEIASSMGDDNGLSIETLINGDNGLHKIYNLPSVIVNGYLDKLDAEGYIKVDRTAGLDMIYPQVQLDKKKILIEYYENKR